MKDTVDMANIGLKGSPTRVRKSLQNRQRAPVKRLMSPEDEAVAIIVSRLAEKHLI